MIRYWSIVLSISLSHCLYFLFFFTRNVSLVAHSALHPKNLIQHNSFERERDNNPLPKYSSNNNSNISSSSSSSNNNNNNIIRINISSSNISNIIINTIKNKKSNEKEVVIQNHLYHPVMKNQSWD